MTVEHNQHTQTANVSGEFAGVYPFVKSEKSRGGWYEETNDTLGSETKLLRHKSGTFFYHGPRGGIQVRIVDDSTIEILGHTNIICNNNGAEALKLLVNGSAEIDVVKDLDLKVGGNLKTTVAGNHIYKIGGSVFREVTNEISSNIGSETKTIQGDSTATHLGTHTSTFKGDTKTETFAANNTISHGQTNMTSGKDGVVTISGPNVSIISSNKVSVLGKQVNIDSTEKTNVSSNAVVEIDAASRVTIGKTAQILELIAQNMTLLASKIGFKKK